MGQFSQQDLEQAVSSIPDNIEMGPYQPDVMDFLSGGKYGETVLSRIVNLAKPIVPLLITLILHNSTPKPAFAETSTGVNTGAKSTDTDKAYLENVINVLEKSVTADTSSVQYPPPKKPSIYDEAERITNDAPIWMQLSFNNKRLAKGIFEDYHNYLMRLDLSSPYKAGIDTTKSFMSRLPADLSELLSRVAKDPNKEAYLLNFDGFSTTDKPIIDKNYVLSVDLGEKDPEKKENAKYALVVLERGKPYKITKDNTFLLTEEQGNGLNQDTRERYNIDGVLKNIIMGHSSPVIIEYVEGPGNTEQERKNHQRNIYKALSYVAERSLLPSNLQKGILNDLLDENNPEEFFSRIDPQPGDLLSSAVENGILYFYMTRAGQKPNFDNPVFAIDLKDVVKKARRNLDDLIAKENIEYQQPLAIRPATPVDVLPGFYIIEHPSPSVLGDSLAFSMSDSLKSGMDSLYHRFLTFNERSPEDVRGYMESIQQDFLAFRRDMRGLGENSAKGYLKSSETLMSRLQGIPQSSGRNELLDILQEYSRFVYRAHQSVAANLQKALQGQKERLIGIPRLLAIPYGADETLLDDLFQEDPVTYDDPLRRFGIKIGDRRIGDSRVNKGGKEEGAVAYVLRGGKLLDRKIIPDEEVNELIKEQQEKEIQLRVAQQLEAEMGKIDDRVRKLFEEEWKKHLGKLGYEVTSSASPFSFDVGTFVSTSGKVVNRSGGGNTVSKQEGSYEFGAGIGIHVSMLKFYGQFAKLNFSSNTEVRGKNNLSYDSGGFSGTSMLGGGRIDYRLLNNPIGNFAFYVIAGLEKYRYSGTEDHPDGDRSLTEQLTKVLGGFRFESPRVMSELIAGIAPFDERGSVNNKIAQQGYDARFRVQSKIGRDYRVTFKVLYEGADARIDDGLKWNALNLGIGGERQFGRGRLFVGIDRRFSGGKSGFKPYAAFSYELPK